MSMSYSFNLCVEDDGSLLLSFECDEDHNNVFKGHKVERIEFVTEEGYYSITLGYHGSGIKASAIHRGISLKADSNWVTSPHFLVTPDVEEALVKAIAEYHAENPFDASKFPKPTIGGETDELQN